MKGSLCLVLAFCCNAGFAMSAWAHDPGLSSATVTVAEHDIKAVAVFNFRDTAALEKNGTLDYAGLAEEILRVRLDGKVLPVTAMKVDRDANDNVTFRLSYPRNITGPIGISSGIIDRLPFGHRELLSVHTDGGVMMGDRMLSARDNLFEASIPSEASSRTIPTAGPRFIDFLLLGIRHILTGYDHLLFLFGLLIVSRNARSAAWLITCFTAAHSLTLALSTFGLINLQSRFIEPAIAASIVYVGIENLFRGTAQLHWRWVLTFAFGLIHGLGFASVLREMGVGSTGANALVPLFAFNLGVEAGQLSIAVFVLPVIWKLRKRPSFLRVGVPACSLVVAFAGAYWLLERTVLS